MSAASDDCVRELIRAVKFIVVVQDMDRALAFYRDVLGLEVGMSSPNWSELRLGEAIVALHPGGSGRYTPTGLSFQVEDIETVCEAVVAGGGGLRVAPANRPGEAIVLAELIDSEGNGFMLSENQEAAPATPA